MNPSEFTLDFYLKCLSQAKWHSDHPIDKNGVQRMRQVARERKGLFLEAYEFEYNKHFPVAAPANEATNPEPQTIKTNTTMNTMLKEIYDILIKPLVEAIDRNTATILSGKNITVEGPYTTITEAPSETPEETPAKKKRGPNKVKEEPSPEPEPPAEEPYMSGPEVVDLMKPLKDTPYSEQLVTFRDEVLKAGCKTRDMTDPDMLRKMEAKVREFLKAHEADQREP